MRPFALGMHLLFDTALMAPVRGWLARPERPLDGQRETPASAWLAVVRAYERMLIGDLPGARPWARLAIEVGSRLDPAACALGRVAEARLLILEGDVKQGLALLDEVGVAPVSGDLDPLSTGVVYCGSYAPYRDSRSTTWPRNGPRRWSGGARRMPSGAFMGAVGSTARRSSDCAGRAARQRQRPLAHARNCALTCAARWGGRCSGSGWIRLRRGDIEGAEEASSGRSSRRLGSAARPSTRAARPRGRSRGGRVDTRRARASDAGAFPRSARRTPISSARRYSRRKSRSRSRPATSLERARPPTS